MGGIRIIAGDMKGRLIPFSNREFDNADITSQKVKGALFSMIGEWLHGFSFLDLFAGSGQIGIEAMSRGADPTVMIESDPGRHRFIASCIKGLSPPVMPMLLNMPANTAIDYLAGRGIRFDYIFLDPPYDRKHGDTPLYRDIIAHIVRRSILSPGGSILLQHYSGNQLDPEISPYQLLHTKKHGKTSLSRYS